MMEPGFPRPRLSPCQQQQQEDREDPCSSPPLSRGSGAVVESPLLDPLLLHQDEAKGMLDTHIHRKGLQLLWGLPRLVQCSLEQSLPALPGFLACTAMHGATDPQRPLFKAERQQGLEHHLREKKMHHKWGLPNRIKRALQPPQSLGGPSSSTKHEPSEIEPLPTDAIPGRVAATKELPPLGPGGPVHLATAKKPPEALLGMEGELLDRGFPQKNGWWSSSSAALDLSYLSPPPTCHQDAPFDAIQSTPEEKGFPRLTPKEWKQKVPLRGSMSCLNCKASSFQSFPLRGSSAFDMENPLQELKVPLQMVSELSVGQGERLKASQDGAPMTALVPAEMRFSTALERCSMAFYPEEEESSSAQVSPRVHCLTKRLESGERPADSVVPHGRPLLGPGAEFLGKPSSPHTGDRDQDPLHPESPGLGGPHSHPLSQEGLWCLWTKRSGTGEEFPGPSPAWPGPMVAAGWEDKGEPGGESIPTKACLLNQWLARKTSLN